MLTGMALFALVHGSMHGAFCWRDLVPELERLGHRAVAPDLPWDDVGAGLSEYAAARVDERSDGARRMDAESARQVCFAELVPFAHWPEVPLDIILARDDRAVRFEWARAEALRGLAGREPKVIPPGDHSPFLSRPALLADTLVACLGGRLAD